MTHHAYLFEAKSIQSYIFATNKLKEIIGGSELIERLSGEQGLVKETLSALQFSEDDIQLSLLGSAAFYAFSEKQEVIDQLSAVWPLIFRQYLPDMAFTHACSQGEDAVQAFEVTLELLKANRNQPIARLPQASVFTRRFPGTGEPVDSKFKGDWVDGASKRKLEFAEKAQLPERVVKGSTRTDWPVNLTPETGDEGRNFPFKGDARLIGLIHADGNGFGQLVMDLKNSVHRGEIPTEHYVQVFWDISQAIKKATESATQQAVEETLEEHRVDGLYPARPIVLGGDDLTMVVRADLALPFTQSFLTAFEKTSQMALDDIKLTYKKTCPALQKVLPSKLTACAGIVYAKSSLPFSLLYELVEDVCKYTKDTAKQPANLLLENDEKIVPSSLTFYRVTTSLVDDFEAIVARELTVGEISLTRGCYAIAEHEHLPHLSALLELQHFLKHSDVSQGALRQVLTLLHQSPEQAQQRYARWREVMKDRDAKTYQAFDDCLKRGNVSEPPMPDLSVSSAQYLPFEDALSLCAVDSYLPKTHAAEDADALKAAQEVIV